MSDQEDNVESEILQRQIKATDFRASPFEVFQYYNAIDYTIVSISAVAALLAGSTRILPSVRGGAPIAEAIC
jgi:hypothetical protein